MPKAKKPETAGELVDAIVRLATKYADDAESKGVVWVQEYCDHLESHMRKIAKHARQLRSLQNKFAAGHREA